MLLGNRGAAARGSARAAAWREGGGRRLDLSRLVGGTRTSRPGEISLCFVLWFPVFFFAI